MASTASFEVSTKDHQLIGKIVDRAMKLGRVPNAERLDLTMDVTACHANGNPLRLAELLEADDANFGHDVWGIQRFINRNTGTLTQCFRPRFSVRERAS